MPSTRTAAYIHSALFALGCLCIGFVQGIVGPTLLDLAGIYGVDTDGVSQVYTSRSIGMLIGAAIASCAVKKRNSELALNVSLLTVGLAISLVPAVNYLWFAHAVFVAVGASVVIFEACSSVILANLWRNPTLQLQIFALGFAFGTFAIPFIVAPFLGATDALGNGKLQPAAVSRIHLPYAGVGALCVLLGTFMVTFSYFVALPLETKAEDNAAVGTSLGGTGDRKKRFDAFEISLVLLLSTLVFSDICVDSTYAGMITPFVVQSPLRMDKLDGALIGGVFRSTFFAGRVLAVFGHKLSARRILLSSLAVLSLSSIVLALFALKSSLVVWLASAGLGFGLSTLYGTGIAWTCQYVSLKHWHMALVMVASSIGSSAPAFLVAPWIDSHPMLLMYVMVGLSSCLWIAFGCMMLAAKGRMKRISYGVS